MRDSTLAFASTIARSHQIATRVDVLLGGAVILEGVAVVDGSVTYDRTAARLARLSLEIADPKRLPRSSADILTPFGYELRVWRGARVGAADELIPLGTFPIQGSSINGTTLQTSITAEDRSRLISDARFEDDHIIAAGTNFMTAITSMLVAGLPTIETLFPSTTFVTPALTFAAQADRWEAAQGMARSIGMELFFDGLGRCVMRAEPTFTGTPVSSIVEGTNLLGVNVALARADAYNRVIATSSNPTLTEVFRGVATDADPSSPTYYFGPFGKKPRFYASPFIASTVQAATAAKALLASELGVAASVEGSALTDPRSECSDLVLVTRAALGIDELHIIEQMSIGLGPESSMPFRTRARQAA